MAFLVALAVGDAAARRVYLSNAGATLESLNLVWSARFSCSEARQ